MFCRLVKPEAGVVGTPKLVVSLADVPVVRGPHLQVASKVGAASWTTPFARSVRAHSESPPPPPSRGRTTREGLFCRSKRVE